LTDLTSAYRAYRADALRAVDFELLQGQGYCFLIELAHSLERSGATMVEVPIQFVNRHEGESKMSARIALESLWVVTKLAFARAPEALSPAPQPVMFGDRSG
jgi:dolichol-phosphate mannosyltransferase